MNKERKFFKIIFLATAGILGAFPLLSLGAEVSISGKQEAVLNQRFKIDVLLDTEKKAINAIEGTIFFDSKLIKFERIYDGDSIVNFWIQKPMLSGSSEIKFSGIMAGGYIGRGKIFSAVFKSLNDGEAEFSAGDFKVFLNDGLGTEDFTTHNNFKITILEADTVIAESDFEDFDDKEPPEAFYPQIGKDPNIYNGKWFLAFAAQDKKSGISRYEVAEKEGVIAKKISGLDWVVFESPYLINDQKLRSNLYVKAVDNAGNERVVVLPAPNPKKWYEDYYIWGIIIVMAFSFAYLRFKKYRHKKRK